MESSLSLLRIVSLLALSFTTLVLLHSSTVYPQERGVGVVPSQSEQRMALVIGNASYPDAPLANSVNDARDVSQSLVRLGFNVMYGENLTKTQMKEYIRQFGLKMHKGGVGLFYYAGHGAQIKGENYLIPVGADINSEEEVEYEGVEVGRVLEKMKSAENSLNIIILDACRNNPYPRTYRSNNKGLAPIDAPRGTLIAYATGPGQVANDGPGRHGLYTQELLKYLHVPGLEVEEVFKKVRAAVFSRSNGLQLPWSSSSVIGEFYFTTSPKGRYAVEDNQPIIDNNQPSAASNSLCVALSALISSSKEGFNNIVGKTNSKYSQYSFKSTVEIPGATYSSVMPGVSVSYVVVESDNVGDVASGYYNLLSKIGTCLPSWEREQSDVNDVHLKSIEFRGKGKDPMITVSYDSTPSRSKYRLMLSVNALGGYLR